MIDIRFAFRQLLKHRGLSALMILALALGIGANTAIYSVLNAVLLRPAPFADADRLVMAWETDRSSGTTREPASVPDFLDYQREARTLRLSALMAGELNFLPPHGDPERLLTLRVSASLLPMLGVPLSAGRAFMDSEDSPGGPPVVLVSLSLARRLFATTEAALGQSLTLDEQPHTIVGVIPDDSDFGMRQLLSAAAYSRSFADRGHEARVDVWAPLGADAAQLPRETHPIFMIGRLAPTATAASAQRELEGLAFQLERDFPVNAGRGIHIEPLGDVIFGPVRPLLYLLLGAVATVLLVACVNVANLLLARGAARSLEIAVRGAVGATPHRLFRQFLVESLVFTGLAVSAGLVIASIGLRTLLSLAPADVPRLSAIGLDGSVLGVALVVAAAISICFGVIPALQARHLSPGAALKDDGGSRGSTGRGHTRLRGLLVVAELAAAVMLLAGSGLLMRSFWNLQHVDAGFHADGILKAEYQLPSSRYPTPFSSFPDFKEQHAFSNALLARAAALPGVTSAALAGNHPLDPGFTNSFRIVGRESEGRSWPEVSVRRVSPGYLETVGLALVSGRWLSDGDVTTAPAVAVINEATARRFFGDRDPLGAQIRFWGIARTIIGVVGNEKFQGLRAAAPIGVYVPVQQVPAVNGAGVLLVKTTGDPAALTRAVRGIFRQQDPMLALFGVEPLAQAVSRSVSQQRFAMLLMTMFASVALLLAASGVYGVISYDVTLRRRELGIRLALGSQRSGVVRLVVSQALVLVSIALVLGVAGALGAGQLLSALLFAVAARDPLTLIGVVIVLGGVALAAAAVPAWRASRIPPTEALRT